MIIAVNQWPDCLCKRLVKLFIIHIKNRDACGCRFYHHGTSVHNDTVRMHQGIPVIVTVINIYIFFGQQAFHQLCQLPLNFAVLIGFLKAGVRHENEKEIIIFFQCTGKFNVFSDFRCCLNPFSAVVYHFRKAYFPQNYFATMSPF